jgi:hydroxylysine kinase
MNMISPQPQDQRQPTLQDIETWCKDAFGKVGTAEWLAGEVDTNAKLMDQTGKPFLVKLSHRDEKADIINFQNNAMAHLAACNASLPVPRVILTKDEQTFATVKDSAGYTRFLRMMTWCPGQAIAQVPKSRAMRTQVGALAGRLAKALSDFSHIQPQRLLLWDMMQSRTLQPRFEALSPDLKSTVGPWYTMLIDEFLPMKHTFRGQIIHNDLNLHNLLTADGTHISGCIDFGDMVAGPVIVELAVASAYQTDPDDVVQSIADVASAFDAEMPLTDYEKDWLIPLTAMRACMTIMITHWTSRLNPENSAYLLRNEPTARQLLDALSRLDLNTARRQLRAALEARQ